MKVERRTLKVSLRVDSQGEDGVLVGYAARYYNGVDANQSEDLGGFRERLQAGCFDKALAANTDVKCLFNHDPNLILGRTGNGSLQVSSDSNGLKFRCQLGKQSYAQDLRESIKSGLVQQCSFAFITPADGSGETWTKERDSNGDLYACRTITNVDELLDVSPVTYPAYPATDVVARAIFVQHEARCVGNVRDMDDCDDPDCLCQNQWVDSDDVWDEDETGDMDGGRSANSKKKVLTKLVDGKYLTKDKFAFVGDPNDTSTWKFPIHDASHAQNALARWGQAKGIPASEKDAVYARIVAAAKKFGLHVNDDSRAARQAFNNKVLSM